MSDRHTCPKCNSTWTMFLLSPQRDKGYADPIYYTRNEYGNIHYRCNECNHNWWKK